MSLLQVEGIYKTKDSEVLLHNISFTQEVAQKICIAGETGSGKSTLLKIVAGLIQPTAGKVLFEGQQVLGPEEKLLPGHPQIAYLSQHFELRNNYRVEEVLEMSNKIKTWEAAMVYDVCRISHLLKRKTSELSGGEKQRIATAKLLITSPKLLLLDEPYSNLDMHHKTILKAVINDIGERLKITCLLVSHDPLDTLSWADEIIVLKAGRLVQQGSPFQVYKQPVDEYTAGLFGKYNKLTLAQASAFSRVNTAGLFTANMLARPEDFILVGKDEGVPGTIEQVNFFGSYYEYSIQLLDALVVVRASNNGMSIGQQVYLSLS